MLKATDLLGQPLNRNDFELRIIEAASKVPLLDSNWVNSEELRGFIYSWMNLAIYYQLTQDTSVAVEVVGEYANFNRLLRELMLHTADPDLKQAADEQLRALEVALLEAVKHASANVDAEG